LPENANRVSIFTESVIREMTRIAIQYDAINLAQGFPDFSPPVELIDAAKRVMDQDYHQYSITWGSPRFREALAAKQRHFMGLELHPDENIVVTCGATEAMIASMLTVCNPSDKVIVFSPFYENYIADTILTGSEPIFVDLKPPSFAFDEEELRNAFRSGAKAIIVCNPSNPSGRVFTLEELQLIANLSQEYDAFVITDEVYEHITYDPHQHTYLAGLPGMFERTLTCGSLSKTYSITGWRLGYVISSNAIINGVKKVHDFLTVGAPAPLQEAAVTALNFPFSYYDELKGKYTYRKEILSNEIQNAGLKFLTPQGAYYILVDISEFGFDSDREFCRWMIENIGIAAVPGSSFFRDNNSYIRLHFAKDEDTLRQVGERLARIKSLI